MPAGGPELSIVVPALNEALNVAPLVEEIDRAVRREAGIDAEVIVVDDGSTDDTARILLELAVDRPWLRVLRRAAAQGQSAAMAAGVAAARAPFVAMLDADLQNDPADLPEMLRILRRENAGIVQGDRSANRRDSWLRRRASAVGRGARRLILGDAVRDTGCSARVLRTELARQIPLQYRGMHRFIPAYCARLGAKVIEYPVRHRPRAAGETKYGVGVLSRGAAGLVDCLVVRWMGRRLRDAGAQELYPGDQPATTLPSREESDAAPATAALAEGAR